MQKHGAEEEKQMNDMDSFLQSTIKKIEDEDFSGGGENTPDGTTGIGDITKLTAPVIALDGKQGNIGWYIDENTPVTVKIANIGKPAKKVKYFITNENAQTIENTVDMPKSGILTLTRPEEGIYVISAKVQDSQGNWSENSESASYARDITVPNIATIVYNTSNANSITVNANGQDALSGIYSYEFEYAKGSETEWKKFENGRIVSTEASTTYTYSQLENTTYKLRVKVSDVAGNISTSRVLNGTYCSGGSTIQERCGTCNGTGTMTTIRDCDNCHGTGSILTETSCESCGGDGLIDGPCPGLRRWNLLEDLLWTYYKWDWSKTNMLILSEIVIPQVNM